METIATYLLRSSVWLAGFCLVYLLFLRNERFFVLNRFYLISGMVAAVVFPLFTWHYTVVLPVSPVAEVLEPLIIGTTPVESSFSIQSLLWTAYLAGIAMLCVRMALQLFVVWKVVRNSEIISTHSVKLIRSEKYPVSFSFFSFVFVNPSVSELETGEIIHHEREHVGQRHWVDLLLFELLCLLQWFNPLVWLYGRMIRQNHEYLADEGALQRSKNPAVYRAALLNQMFGVSVISLANSFNYSLNKKRFDMMKKTISSPTRKLKLLLVLPLIAGVFYAFATPEYQFTQVESPDSELKQPVENKAVKGKVVDENGKPLKNSSVIISGKTIGTVTDNDGRFMLKLTDDSPLVISYVGFETQKINPDFDKEMVVTMKRNIVSIDFNKQSSETIKKKPIDINNPNALIIVDGSETSKYEFSRINPDKIESIDVLKSESAKVVYGEKGKDGVILITLKKDDQYPPTIKVQTNSPLKFSSADGSGKQPLIVKDGVIADNQNLDNIPPETIESVNVLKDEAATAKYGEKGKNGVVEITMKKPSDAYVFVEEMPEFPGGIEALKKFVALSLKYPADALEKGIQGRVFVRFVVDKTGNVTNAKVSRSVVPSLDKEALRIVETLPKWKPGTQGGQKVDVNYELPIDFKLPAEKIAKEKLH